jgi:hypothetical protein
MATTLVPTVHQRIARCNTSIFLDRLAAGADVIVAVDGTEHNATAGGSTMHFPVPSLAGGEIIHAKQDAGSGFTPWSPDVEVEAVILPPVVSPHLPEEVGTCSQCVHVYGMVPGSDVELSWSPPARSWAPAEPIGVAPIALASICQPWVARGSICSGPG